MKTFITSLSCLSFLLLTLFFSTSDLSAQNDVLFHVESTSSGILIPSMTEIQRQDIVNPSTGLLVYQNDNAQGFYYFDGVEWLLLADQSGIATNTLAIQDTAMQIRADIPDVSGFLTSESDPVYTGSEAANITSNDITNLGNLSGTNTGDQDISGIGTNTQAIQDTAAQIRADILSGTQAGEMQYWDGTSWVTLAPGSNHQVLTFCNGTPTWTSGGYCYPEGTVHCSGTTTAVVDVTNPITTRIWMDRNLGATQVATSSTDAASYGDLYQWGRGADGHQCRISDTTSILSSIDQPGHGEFITTSTNPGDWRSPQNDTLWQGLSGTNNPCPSGYRLPTKAEWEAEIMSWNTNDAAGAFGSPLKLPLAGYRGYSGGSLSDVGSDVYYWSSTVSGTSAHDLYFSNGTAGTSTSNRASGEPVRCIKD